MPEDAFGDALPPGLLPDRKRQLTDHEQRSRKQRFLDCIDMPLMFELAELLPAPKERGRPRRNDPVVLLMLAALTTVFGSKRSAVGALDSAGWSAVRASVRRHEGRLAAARMPDTPPTRNQYEDAEIKVLAPAIEALSSLSEQRAMEQAIAQGLFPQDVPRTWSRPHRRQLMVGDATVPKAPSRAEREWTVDPRTGEEVRHRYDPAASIYYENGEQAKRRARGTKWFIASARDDGYWRRVIFTIRHVAGGEYEDEAAVAVRAFQQLCVPQPGCLGVVYDGAFRGKHRDALSRDGLLVINLQHGSTTPRAYEMLRFGRCRHDLWCDQGRIAERNLLDDGTSFLAPVPIDRLEHRSGRTKSRWYHWLRINCRNGQHHWRVPVGITTTPADRISVDTKTGKRKKSDAERGFHRAELLQQIPENTLAHQQVYSYRSDAESVHSQLDQALWNRRMISYGLERQKVWTLGFVLAQNATSRAIHRELYLPSQYATA
ncbi:hypothetical protein ABZ874_24635 [Streptomyces albidoflavus]|uniref:hypothetical protein n=1 Tax=Streptomyces albidoflavus TaxID=1886 RepID=UPI00340E320B